MTWYKTKSDEEAQERSVKFWSDLSASVRNGSFWADKVKEVRGEPLERLKISMENLPLPGAFREAAIAIRFVIRGRRKSNLDYTDPLSFLYWLAAIDSFCVPYSFNLQTRGMNVSEIIPGEKIKSLEFSYYQLGYKKLELLKTTDVKWLVECWGEPQRHSTLNNEYKELWLEYEAKYELMQREALRRFLQKG